MKIQHTKGNLILVNTYMPTAGTHTNVKYEEVVDEIHEPIQKFYPDHGIFWVGDMIAYPDRAKSPYDKKFIQLCSENKLEVCKKLPPKSTTFHYFNEHSSSRIDLVVQPCDQPCLVKSATIGARNIINNSCQDPFIINL
jgi:hypothetical protein